MPTIVLSEQPLVGSQVIYDPGADPAIFGEDEESSKVFVAPSVLVFSNLDSGTTVNVEVKVHQDDDWIPLAAISVADAYEIYIMPAVFNFVRVARNGSHNFRVSAQGQYVP